MRLDELTAPGLILPAIDSVDRVTVLRQLAQQLALVADLDADLLYQRLDEREALGSTAIGHRVAVPHCRMEGVAEVVLAVGITRADVDFKGGTLGPVRLFFVVVAPADRPAAHLKCLQAISRRVQDEQLVERLLTLEDPVAIFHLLGAPKPPPTTP